MYSPLPMSEKSPFPPSLSTSTPPPLLLSSSKETASPDSMDSLSPPQHQSRSVSVPFLIPSNSIGSLWSVSMHQLKYATSLFEVSDPLSLSSPPVPFSFNLLFLLLRWYNVFVIFA